VNVTDAANRAVIAYDVAESKGARVVLPKAIVAGVHGARRARPGRVRRRR